MIENQPPRLENATPEELENAEKPTAYFPWAVAIVIGVLIVLIIACFILIKVFGG